MFNFKRLKTRFVQAEPYATPRDLALWPGAWREVFRKRRRIPLSDVKRFTRTNVGDGLELFSAGQGARTLIVAFTTRAGRMLVPTAVFLQHLDEREFDVLGLYDFNNLHFDRGTGECNSSLFELAGKVRRIAGERGYAGLVTYGASMGGLPALRGGHLMGADRSISVGGNFAWHVARLRSGGRTVGAFDPLCDCSLPLQTESYLLYAEGHPIDVEHADRASAIDSNAVRLPMPTRYHDFPFLIYKTGRLADFHQQMFDLRQKPDLQRLRALVEKAGVERRQPEAGQAPAR